MRAYLRRGFASGLLAGLLAGLFAFLLAEPLLDRAIALETGHAHEGTAAHDHAETEVFDRGEQKVGLFLALGFYGGGVGTLFGLGAALLRDRLRVGGELRRSLMLAGAVFVGAVFAPFLKYPPNPPGVGSDPATLGTRTLAYLGMAALCLLALFFAGRLARELADLSAPVRRSAVAVFLLGCFALLYAVLPPGTGSGDAPAALVWGFRLSSLGTQAVLWAGIGVFFGLLMERAEGTARAVSREAVR